MDFLGIFARLNTCHKAVILLIVLFKDTYNNFFSIMVGDKK